MPARRQFHFGFEGAGFGPEELLVTSFQGSEAVSELFRFEIDLASVEQELDLTAMIGEPGTLTISDPGGDRFVHGVIASAETAGFGSRYARYRVTLVPQVWPLLLRRRSRIYEELSVPDIVRQVLDADGIPSDRYRINAAGTHAVREYCVQYRESDWDFGARLLEEEGFRFYFEHDDRSALLVIDDSAASYPPIEGDGTVNFHDPRLGVREEDLIWELTAARRMTIRSARLRDFDFKRPRNLPEAQSTCSEGAAQTEENAEEYDYPGGFVGGDMATAMSLYRAGEHAAAGVVVSGRGDVARFRPGFRWTLDGHTRGDLNREYAVIRVTHTASQEMAAQDEAEQEAPTVYENQFECIPADVSYRPPRRTPRPRVRGTQTAMVVGPQGEEIHTDVHGRIRVNFHWNRLDGHNDGSSCWIRVGQIWAGAGWGAVFIPRIGHEVVVSFLEGDPDRPLVIGSVYNGVNPPPYDLPGQKTKSTIKSESTPGGGGFNELRFEDAKGSEEIWLHGQKDWNIQINNDKTGNIGHDESITVGRNRYLKVKKNETIEIDVDRDETIGANRTEKVGATHDETIGGSKQIKILGSRTESVAGSSTEAVVGSKSTSVGGSLTLLVGGAVSATFSKQMSLSISGAREESVGAEQTLNVSGDRTTVVGGADTIQVTGDRAESIAGGLSISADGKYGLSAKSVKIEAKDEITLKVGSAELIMKKSGDITLKGAKIKIEGSGKVIVKGSQTAIN